MIDLSKLVTKDYLKKFGDKSHMIFKHSPKCVNGRGSGLLIETSLKYNDYQEGFDQLYCQISGISETLSRGTKEGFRYSLYASTDYLYRQLDFAEGYSFGKKHVPLTLFIKNQSGLLNIYILISYATVFINSEIDIAVYLGDILKYDIINDVRVIDFPVEPESTYDYEQILAPDTVPPFLKVDVIGNLVQLELTPTNFTVIEDYQIIDEERQVSRSKSYEDGVQFDDIYHSKLSDEISHPITFQYDWNTYISREDDPVELNSTLKEEEVLTIPVPDILENGADSQGLWVNSVKVENGIVTEAEYVDIPVADENTVGGFILGNASVDSVGDKVWVQLDTYNRAFIDRYFFDSEKHRDDLTLQKYHDNIENYKNQIWQHIGNTTTTFVNGQFYKCVKISYTVLPESSIAVTPYYMGPLVVNELESYIYSTHSTLDLNKKFRLYVAAEDYPTTKTNPDLTTSYVKISEIENFKLINIDGEGNVIGEPVTLTKAQLLSVLDTTIKTTDGWDTALTKDYNISVMTFEFSLNSNTYNWRLWDVLPRDGVGSAIQYVTNAQIDYLFETHVTELTLDNSSLECHIGDVELLTVTILPVNASNKSVSWTSSNPTVAVVTSDGEVHCIFEGQCIITCTSNSDDSIYAECEIIVTPQNQVEE